MADRLAYLEIVRQLDYFDVINLRSYEKNSFIPATLCFSDFIVLAKEGYDQILGKLLDFNMNKPHQERILIQRASLTMLNNHRS